ncbi:hypothetical protein FA95DRAFT_1577886 [Auriscalpium vulgare]|uniref:Uncharacterized protein n=1 Tax=Auriscalpium vulgare TaxID=40419 RepID=A0ACB8R5U6_9AGAM|nr:hypothetical protein FA95DRAFT_1577886 [Auriscalpium vulgare]
MAPRASSRTSKPSAKKAATLKAKEDGGVDHKSPDEDHLSRDSSPSVESDDLSDASKRRRKRNKHRRGSRTPSPDAEDDNAEASHGRKRRRSPQGGRGDTIKGVQSDMSVVKLPLMFSQSRAQTDEADAQTPPHKATSKTKGKSAERPKSRPTVRSPYADILCMSRDPSDDDRAETPPPRAASKAKAKFSSNTASATKRRRADRSPPRDPSDNDGSEKPPPKAANNAKAKSSSRDPSDNDGAENPPPSAANKAKAKSSSTTTYATREGRADRSRSPYMSNEEDDIDAVRANAPGKTKARPSYAPSQPRDANLNGEEADNKQVDSKGKAKARPRCAVIYGPDICTPFDGNLSASPMTPKKKDRAKRSPSPMVDDSDTDDAPVADLKLASGSKETPSDDDLPVVDPADVELAPEDKAVSLEDCEVTIQSEIDPLMAHTFHDKLVGLKALSDLVAFGRDRDRLVNPARSDPSDFRITAAAHSTSSWTVTNGFSTTLFGTSGIVSASNLITGRDTEPWW